MSSEPPKASAAPVDILPAEHWAKQPLQDDPDSAYDDAASSTASLSASIFEYRTLHGRTYHSDRNTDAEYWTPNDERMVQAGDIAHHTITLALDGALFRAPLKPDIQTALDIGTGSGIWALDFADKFPDCSVIGTDISPIQPTYVPPNLKFELEDATQEWTFPDNHFDYIHMTYLFGAIADWNTLLKRAYHACKPGGYVESFETTCVFKSDDGTLLEGSPMDQWGKVFVEAGRKFGRPFDVVGDNIVDKAFVEAGFEDITTWDFKCPTGGWSEDKKLKEIGSYALLALTTDLEGWVLYVWTAVMGWTKEETTAYIAHLRKQFNDKRVHAYVTYRCIYGRKPLNARDDSETAD
ncbi:Phosphomethylethanolamine N-methyltransferase [Podospora aff. communis PSN243]|uniref:Phosphomethylethanolamine N-methyltransferase n=1 Tax=Podospora aff. communis PSN243 TaxID=3040156 RepID=A0AAV9GI32_9PEZI|nr:Phosphomethylethanolamine N-methyltransferase [Podospora aff. communis PSN243]